MSNGSSNVCSSDRVVAAAHQKFAVQSRRYVDVGDDLRETCRNIVARARIEPRLTTGMDDLHANAVPFPFGGIVRHVDHRLIEGMGEHEGPKKWLVASVRRRAAFRCPAEQGAIRWRLPMPIFLDIVDAAAEGLRNSRLGEARRNADAHRACRTEDRRGGKEC